MMGRPRQQGAAEWMDLLDALSRAVYPDLAERDRDDRPARAAGGLGQRDPGVPADAKGVASRDSSQKVLNAIAKHVPWLIGGAADLAPSTKSNLTFDGRRLVRGG